MKLTKDSEKKACFAPFVSIVVPVYKVKDYLDNCIQSLVNQTERNIEVVLVDDGSPDDSPQICDKWASTDARIKVVHQNNQGVTKARANGVGIASGEWILFVDGDDVIPVDSIKEMLEFTQGVDIVVGQVEFTGPYKWPFSSQNKEYDRDEYVLDFLKRKIHGGPVAKLFRKNLFDESTFDIPAKIKCGEDLIMNLRLARNAQSARMIEGCVYHYIFRESSAVTVDPFVSIRYTLLFNRLVSQSIEITCLPMRFAVWKNLFNRIFECFKSKIKKMILR